MTELIEWNDSLSVGIPEIDLQHKKLLKIAGELYELCVNGTDLKNQLPVVLKRLTDYTVYHFTEEEKFQRKYGYEQVDFHKLQHDQFVTKVMEQINKLNTSSVKEALEFYKFLAMWVTMHIAKADKDWAVVIKQKM